jgi:ubiquinone/menaquinone biosynthesis C-methylase UbiE
MKTDFFDQHADRYIAKKIGDYYDRYVVDSIIDSQAKNLLDIGGASGTFASFVKDCCSDIDVTVVDPSRVFLDLTTDTRIHKIEGRLPNQLNLDHKLKFDYVTVQYVFHHIVGPTIDSSKNLFQQSLCSINDHLKRGGYLLIRECFYESYKLPTLTRSFIFYVCKLQNLLQVTIPGRDFKQGLEVCFYTREELMQALNQSGFTVVKTKEVPSLNNLKKKLLFLNKRGAILITAKKS